jgi:hypothetical protein
MARSELRQFAAMLTVRLMRPTWDNVAICFDASNQNAQFLPKLAAAGLAQRVNGSPASVILNIENPP